MPLAPDATLADVAAVVRRHGKRCVEQIKLNPHPAPIRTVGASEHTQKIALREWISCPQCTKTFVAAAIVTAPPQHVQGFMRERYTGWCVRRELFCDFCDVIIGWHQRCEVVPVARPGTDHPIVCRLAEEIGTFDLQPDPKKIDAFLRAHPEARGVAHTHDRLLPA